MVFKWRDSDTDRFLTLYKGYDFLWDYNNPLYKNRKERIVAYKRIIGAMNIPDLTVGDVKNKIKTIRTNYKCELDKVLKSEKIAIELGDDAQLYVPHVFWFRKADEFLRKVFVSKSLARSKLNSDPEEDTLLSFTNTEDTNNAEQQSDLDVCNIKIEDTQIEEDNTNFEIEYRSPTVPPVPIPKAKPEAPNSVTIPSDALNTSTTVTKPKTVLTLPTDITISTNDVSSPPRFLFRSIAPKSPTATDHNTEQTPICSGPTCSSAISIRKREAHLNSLQKSINKLQKTIELRKELEEDEFDFFGKSIAVQLKRMPLNRALICQANMQRVMIQERLEQSRAEFQNGKRPRIGKAPPPL